MSVLSGFIGLSKSAAADAVSAAAKAKKNAGIVTSQKAVVGALDKSKRFAARASRHESVASSLQTIDKATAIPRAIGRTVGGAVGGVARGSGRAAGWLADHPRSVVGGSIALGAASGLSSGIRETAQSANRELGNPVGSYAQMMTRTAFSGNPNNSRSKPNGASGMITINSGRR